MKNMNMTPKKRKILDYVGTFIKKNRYSPSIKELADYFDVSVPTMWEHLEQLSSMGLIERKPFEKRSLLINEEYEKE